MSPTCATPQTARSETVDRKKCYSASSTINCARVAHMGNSPQAAASVNYDGAVLPLYDPYAILGGSPIQYEHRKAIIPRVPVWWPAQFRPH